MMEQPPIVFVVDDDGSIRDALRSLIRSAGLGAQLFGSSREFLQAERPDVPSCLVLDVRLPGKSGLDLQRELIAANSLVPIIFITGHGDLPMSERAMKAGAVAFLTKPFRDEDLLDAIQVALQRDRNRRVHEAEAAILRERFESLTSSERKILHLAVAGRLEQQIAAELETSEALVEVHLSQIMKKIGAVSTADLFKMSDRM